MNIEDTPAISAEIFVAQIKGVDSDTIILSFINRNVKVEVQKTTLLQRLINQREKG